MVRSRLAIVDDEPGVTRDRNYRETAWAGKRFFLVDTGGLVPGSGDAIESRIRGQVEIAMTEAAMIVFLLDGSSGVTALDREIAEILRKGGKPFLVVVNKMDIRQAEAGVNEFYELGLGDFLTVSGEHGTGVGELLDAVVEGIPAIETESDAVPAIAVVGKPNVGKSSLVNRLAGEETVIVDDRPGTTRDSIDTMVRTPFGDLNLVDTAGLRRRSKADTDLEKHANLRSVRAIERSDLAVVMLDAESGITRQDLTITARVERAGRGIVLAWNKWDLKGDAERESHVEETERRFRHLPYVPTVFISCLTGFGIRRLMDTCVTVYGNLDDRIPTGILNRMLQSSLERKPPRGQRGRRGKIYYVSQTGSRPPTFTLFVNDTSLLTENYRRYVEKKIRAINPFRGCPVRIRLRKSK
jgi:GTP-binding protein